jgi:hypothetical protein
MDDSVKARVLASWNQLPEGCRLRRAAEADLVAFESEWIPIPVDFRWFLAMCGGGVVGCEWIDNIDRLHKSHAKYRRESGPGGWTMRDFFIVGWDGAGNPYGIRLATGEVVVEDHNFGGVHVLASSFESFLLNGVVGSGGAAEQGDEADEA